jgi:ATP-dependent RNA helicase DHX8/PRP22
VGYTIRFDDKTSSKTKLRYITDGIFVRQCVADPYLFKYHVVILDEAHERSLYTDILFALIKKAVIHRKGTLKLIVTSATLNTKTFSNYYAKCPVIQMHGKLFPVEVKYFPIKHNSRV